MQFEEYELISTKKFSSDGTIIREYWASEASKDSDESDLSV